MNEDLAGHVASIFPDEPDDVPIFLSGEHGTLLAELRQDLAAGRRFICVIGAAGSGKTRLMQALREDYERAHFEQSLIGLAAPSPKDPLLFALMEGLGLQVPDRDAPAARQRLSVILAMAEKKATPVLQIVDSAERLAPDELSTIFQLFGPSFTQVVLSGRPELLDLLADERRPLGVARPDVVRRLEGLAAADTDAYIRHRLWQARLPDDLFDTGASAAVHECSGGIPRSINAIAREALVRAEAAGEDRVDRPECARAAWAALQRRFRHRARRPRRYPRQRRHRRPPGAGGTGRCRARRPYRPKRPRCERPRLNPIKPKPRRWDSARRRPYR
jgi:general secretion pathway protein A